MPNFEEHYKQYCSNIDVLNHIFSVNKFWDWKVTISYYAALHLVNAHIDNKANLHYLTHSETVNSINPYNVMSVCKVPDDVFCSYKKLQQLSRRSRYLANDNNPNIDADKAHFTSEKHLNTSLTKLKIITDFFNKEYGYHIQEIKKLS